MNFNGRMKRYRPSRYRPHKRPIDRRVLILAAVMKLVKGGVKDKLTGSIFILAFLIMVLFGLSPIVIVLFAAIAGLASKMRGKEEGSK